MSDIKIVIINIYLQEQLLHVSYHIALAATSEAQEIQLRHIVTALDYVLQHKIEKTNKIKYMDLFTHILITLDLKKPTDEDSIYAKSNYPVSKSIRAYLCVGLLYWVTTYMEHLSIDEDSLFLELIEPLMEDACGKEIGKHVERISEIEQLEHRVKDFLRKLFCSILSKTFINFNVHAILIVIILYFTRFFILI